MKIKETTSQTNPIPSGNEHPAAKSRATRNVKSGTAETTRVDISKDSIEFQKIRESMQREIPERSKRVSELKEKIKNGSYRVDSSEVASKIIADALDSLK